MENMSKFQPLKIVDSCSDAQPRVVKIINNIRFNIRIRHDSLMSCCHFMHGIFCSRIWCTGPSSIGTIYPQIFVCNLLINFQQQKR